MKELKIVCDEKRECYGELLSNLIASYDDVEKNDKTEVVGTPDGMVKATVIKEDVFEANKHKATSNNKVLFIGNSKIMKENRIGIKYMFDKYGIKFGWLGNHAYLFVDDVPYHADEYEKFIKFFKQYRDNAEELKTKKKFLNKKSVATGAGVGAVAGGLGASTTVPVATTVVASTAPVTFPILAPVAISMFAVNAIQKKKIKNKIKKQQYECGVLVAYMEYINQFLDIKEQIGE